jgi:uncharacterized protein
MSAIYISAICGVLQVMSLKIQKPILVGGLAATAGFLGLDLLSHAVASNGSTLILGTMAIGGSYWIWSQRRGSAAAQPVKIDTATLTALSNQVALIADRLTAEGGDSVALRQSLTQAVQQIDRQHYRLAVTGAARVGKTSVIAALPATDFISAQPVELTETPALFEVDGADLQINQALQQADLVVFVTNGDLTATEFAYLSKLQQQVVVVLNKQDQIAMVDREVVYQNIQRTVTGITNQVVAVAAKPAPIKVRTIAASGDVQESIEQPSIEITPLTNALRTVLAESGEQLVLNTTYWEVERLKNTGKAQLNELRRARALPIIEQRQWIAGATAFANPLPALDLLATAAINSQTIVDLSAIYQQPFSIELGQSAASAMGGLLLKLGLVEISTQAIGNILKTNAVTYVAGGLLQGMSAAYLTRIVGLTLIEYFADQDIVATQSQPIWHLDRFSALLQQVFQANQRLTVMQEFVQQGIQRLIPDPQPQAS